MKLKIFFIKYAYLFPFKVSFLMKFYPNKVIFPFYHSVSNTPQKFIKNLYSVKNEDDFKADIEFLTQYFKSISIVEFNNWVKDKSIISKPSFFLSFDDGLKTFLNIAPYLQRNKVETLCFLNSDFVNNKELFYRYKVSILIENIRNQDLKLREVQFVSKLLNIVGSKTNLLSWLKRATSDDVNKINKVAEFFKISFKSFLNEQKIYLDELQIEKLIKEGVYFGAHSCSHPNYEVLSDNNQVKETLESINYVQSKFHLNYKYFSFPFNDWKVSDKVFEKLNQNNVISFGTSGLKDETLENHFQRIPMEYTEKYSAKNIIKGELIYYILKRLTFTNRNKR